MNINPGLYKKHGGHFLIVASAARKYLRVISTQAGELQLRRTTEDHLTNEGYKPCDNPPLAEAITKFAAHPGGVSEAAKAALLQLKESNMDVSTASTQELVQYYNKHAESPIKKFKDRATAEKRVQAMLDAAPKEAEVEPKKARAKKSTAEVKHLKSVVTVTIKKGDKETVKEFRSVFVAFEELGLPINKHRAFRKELKMIHRKVFDSGNTQYEFRA